MNRNKRAQTTSYSGLGRGEGNRHQWVAERETEERRYPASESCPVNSYNGWDPLEEVVVGTLEGANIPPAHPSVTFNVPKSAAALLKIFGGWKYPRFLIKSAQRQLDEFIHILESEGVKVRRPDPLPFSKKFKTPLWSSRGFCIACPRDGFMVVGNEILETPMAWRCRYFEMLSYRALFNEYFRQGARWTAAPKPSLVDELYDQHYVAPRPEEPMRYVIKEFEPVFDAADFVRCGRDLFGQLSNVTNQLGFEWLRRHLGSGFRVHQVETQCRMPMHIDSTFVPLAPGKLLINPEYMDRKKVPKIFDSWDVIVAPQPDPAPGALMKYCAMSSAWISINVLMLDEERVVVEKSQTSMIRVLREHGFKPIPCAFSEYMPFGGSFHCATLDVRRQGGLQSYF